MDRKISSKTQPPLKIALFSGLFLWVSTAPFIVKEWTKSTLITLAPPEWLTPATIVTILVATWIHLVSLFLSRKRAVELAGAAVITARIRTR